MKNLVRVAIGMWILVVVHLGFLGITDRTLENDSRIYHIPIAESVLSGKVFSGEGYASPFSYYPGASEVILAVLMMLHVPINLFNVLGILVLFWGLIKLARRVGISIEGAIIMGVGITMLPTVLRLPMTQLVDIWLAVWWVWWIYLMEDFKPKQSWWLKWGFVTGMLVGTKILGPILVIMGIGFYVNKIWKAGAWSKSLGGIGLAMALGGFWYIRNWLLKGNPMYPLDFLGLPGDSGSQLPIVWKFLLSDRGAVGLFGQALVSEFLGLVFLFFSPIFVRNKWIWLGVLNALVFLILPGSPGTIVSNCRYLLPAIIPLMVGVSLWMDDKKMTEWWGAVVVVNAMAVLPQLDYKPKLLLGAIMVWAVILWMKKPVVKV